MPHWLETTIDGKAKTGDSESLGILWAAHQSVTGVFDPLTADGTRKTYSRDALTGLRGELAPVSSSSGMGLVNRPVLTGIQRMLTDIVRHLGPDGHQFALNLVLFNFRTAEGERVRKSTEVLRHGADEYARPFESALPDYIRFLLGTLPPVSAKDSASPPRIRLVSRVEDLYVPPTRFTASFPLALDGQSDADKKLLSVPHLPTQKAPPHPSVRYKFLPSFGFAEPGYCTWEKGSRSEFAGTRLSLGSYALNSAYLQHLHALLRAMDPTTQKNYAKYGGVGKRHVEELIAKFHAGSGKGWSEGSKLAVGWAFQLLRIARALVTAAAAKASEARGEPSLAGLLAFFQYVQHNIGKREVKLDFIWETRGAYPEGKRINDGNAQFNSQNLFDRLWVIESTLWEYALLGATCLSMAEIEAVLRRVVPGWTPSVGVSSSKDIRGDSSLREEVEIGASYVFDRFYFSSGTSAAEKVCALLDKLGYPPYAVKVDASRLSTFTPYFDFYQQATSFLSPEEVSRTRTSGGPKVGRQLWLNLSDSLHSSLLDTAGKQAGAAIARLVAQYIQQQIEDPSEPLFLVIDYTKFASDIPNSRLYPMLAQLQQWLVAALGKERVDGILFLRSNLKYNTGSLDRYQLGEVMCPQDNRKDITAPLHEHARQSFVASGNRHEWNLRGEYIPLTRKLYLLSDAIGSGRWDTYSRLWDYTVSTPSLEGPGLPRPEFPKLRTWLLAFIENPLAPIFTRLVNEMKSKSHRGQLTEPTRLKVSTLWKRLTEDRESLKAMKTKTHPELEPKVHEVSRYLEPMLDEIITEMGIALRGISKSSPEAKRWMGTYLSRLKAAREKVSLQADLKKLGPAPSPSPSSPPTRVVVPSTAFSPARASPRVGSDTHWYTDDEINQSLGRRLAARADVYRMNGIDARQHAAYTLTDNLREARNAIRNSAVRIIILPVNVHGNHWTALYLRFGANDALRENPFVRYVDPLMGGAGPVPEWLRNVLRQLFRNPDVQALPGIVYQRDHYNCGPWTVALLEHMVLNNGALPGADAIDIGPRRAEDSRHRGHV